MSPIPGLPEGSILYAINNAGQIAGQGFAPPGPDGASPDQAFLWQDGVVTFLGSLANPTDRWQSSWAEGINNKGQIVGWSILPQSIVNSTCDYDAFLWQDGVMTDLGTLGGACSEAYAINDNGWIVGLSDTADGEEHAALWIPVPEPGSMAALGLGILGLAVFNRPGGRLVAHGRGSAVNKILLVAVLICICAARVRAVSYVIQDLGPLGGADSYAYGVNQLGQVVGVSDAADGTQHAFLWQNGVMTHLGAGYACGINDSGQVALSAMTSDGYYHASIWQNGAVTDLGIGAAQAINNEGQVVGNTIASDGSEHAFLYSNGGHD